jgi:hypothetical protein
MGHCSGVDVPDIRTWWRLHSVQQIIQIGQIDWASAAKQLDTEVNLLKWMTYIQTYGTLVLSLIMLALCEGMWIMKKWGAVISLGLGVISVVVLVMIPFRGTISGSLTEIIIFVLFVAIGVGQLLLWRKGELT